MTYFNRCYAKYPTICLIKSSLKELKMAKVIRKANSWMDRFEITMGMWAEKIF